MLQTSATNSKAPAHLSNTFSITRSLHNQAETKIVVGKLKAKETILNHFFSIFTIKDSYLFLAILLLYNEFNLFLITSLLGYSPKME